MTSAMAPNAILFWSAGSYRDKYCISYVWYVGAWVSVKVGLRTWASSGSREQADSNRLQSAKSSS